MRVTREIPLAAAPDIVWPALWDVPRMVGCVPGCSGAQEIESRRRYAARMTQQVGPIRLSVNLDVEVSLAGPQSLVLAAKGRDSAVATSISMTVKLDLERAEPGSLLHLDAEGRVLGRLGSLGHPIIQRKAEELVDEFAARLALTLAG